MIASNAGRYDSPGRHPGRPVHGRRVRPTASRPPSTSASTASARSAPTSSMRWPPRTVAPLAASAPVRSRSSSSTSASGPSTSPGLALPETISCSCGHSREQCALAVIALRLAAPPQPRRPRAASQPGPASTTRVAPRCDQQLQQAPRLRALLRAAETTRRDPARRHTADPVGRRAPSSFHAAVGGARAKAPRRPDVDAHSEVLPGRRAVTTRSPAEDRGGPSVQTRPLLRCRLRARARRRDPGRRGDPRLGGGPHVRLGHHDEHQPHP